MTIKKEYKLVALGVIALIISILYIFPALGMPLLSVVGITTLSCDYANYETTDTHYIDGSLFCAMALTGSAKEASFSFDQTTLLSKFGIQTEKTGTLSATFDGSQCSYKFYNESYPVYSYTIIQDIRWSQSGTWYCSSPSSKTIAQHETYIGSTPISCSKSCKSLENHGTITGCEYVFRDTTGVFYYLDPSIFNDFSATLNMEINGQTESATLSQTSPTVRTDLFTAELLGGLSGQQSCPSQPSVSAYIENVATTQPLSYKSKYYAEALYTKELQMVDAQSIVSGLSSFESIKNAYLNSVASTGQYCAISTTAASSLQDATIECTPTGTTYTPVFNLYVPASEFSIIIPSGQPEIISVSFDQASAADETKGIITVKNTGESDSFDGSITGAKELCSFSQREYIETGETKNIEISCEGAGIIGDYTVEVHSVNSPDHSDTTTIKINMLPFCAKSSPTSEKELVFTEYGCEYICSNYGEEDAFDSNCQEITDYDRCNYQTTNGTIVCASKDSYTGYHCTGVGTYASTNKYMDKVYDGKLEAFIPQTTTHQYFIVSDGGRMVCQYVNEYGYISGTAIDELEFDYSQEIPDAEEIIYQDEELTEIECTEDAYATCPDSSKLLSAKCENGLYTYVSYKCEETPTLTCSADATQQCPDGSEIVTAICTDGNYEYHETSCSTVQEVEVEDYLSYGVIILIGLIVGLYLFITRKK
jgi:hypothetical protein